MDVVQLWVVKNAPGPTLGVLEAKSGSGPVWQAKSGPGPVLASIKQTRFIFGWKKTGPGPVLAGRNGPGPVLAQADQFWQTKVARPVHLGRAKSGPDPLFARKIGPLVHFLPGPDFS